MSDNKKVASWANAQVNRLHEANKEYVGELASLLIEKFDPGLKTAKEKLEDNFLQLSTLLKFYREVLEKSTDPEKRQDTATQIKDKTLDSVGLNLTDDFRSALVSPIDW